MTCIDHSTGKQMLARRQLAMIDPTEHGLSSLLGNLELNRPLRLLLHDDGTMEDALALCDILNAETYQVAAAKLTFDRQVKAPDLSNARLTVTLS